jgi:ATPase subunit of ABC transporter with duplicated ATPase domains
MRGDRIAIVGPNGIGKTTLIKMLKGQVKPDAGKIEWGYETHVGYMPQDHAEEIEKSDMTAHKWLWQWNNHADEENLRALFGRLLFSKDEPMKPTKVLSGGETVRLLLAKLMITQPNVLLLDEPTNHLDLEAIRSLTLGLASYEGTAVFVTHDRQMVSRVATRVIEMSEDGVRELSTHQFDDGEFLLGHGRKKSA